MRAWLNVNGEYINLAAATSIVELDRKNGLIGYTIYHGGSFTTIRVSAVIETMIKPDRKSEEYKTYRIIVIIRNYLYDRMLQDTNGSRRDDD
jgi:hypothetical protein